jgi:cation diffusion facilitator CzcD-associated flavoprotein CzcO
MLHSLRQFGLAAEAFEAGSGVGGTWFWNRYPGARCDVESLEYSYSFSDELQQEWEWTERYPTQPEMLRYLNHVASRFNLRPHIRLETKVVAATFDEVSKRWTIRASDGTQVSAQFCIMATGCLSVPSIPEFKGIDEFAGRTYHTGNWPQEGVDFDGLRVGVIGTGSSGIQIIPLIAERAAHLFVFQRTPNFSVPALNGPIDPEYQRQIKANYREFRHKLRTSHRGTSVRYNKKSALEVGDGERRREYQERWGRGGFAFLGAYGDLITNKDANDTAVRFLHAKIRQLVHDPVVAAALSPIDHPVGTKRMCVDTNYYETYNRSNVTLVDIRDSPILEITQKVVRTQAADYELDSIVFATGFDAMTGALLNIDLRGRAGVTLRQKWAEGPRTYLGIAVAEFPNLFTITGPGSPSVLSNMAVSIEQHVDWIADCIMYMRQRDFGCIEATPEAEDAWVEHVKEAANATLYPSANSWYIGAHIPGRPRVFMPYVADVGGYRKQCEAIASNNYPGFVLSEPGVNTQRAGTHPSVSA